MTRPVPLDTVWGPTVLIPLLCLYLESDDLGLCALPDGASVSVTLVLCAAVLMGCGQTPVGCGSMMNALWL